MSGTLVAREMWKSYGPRHVLSGADLLVPGGEITGLIGPNGAGKTTLLRLLCGFLRPSSGTIATDAGDVARSTAPAGLAHFGGGHTVPPGVSAHAWSRDVSGGAWEGDDRRKVRDLSRGTRQMLGLKATLAREGISILILDEPWEGLDPDGARWLNASLLEKSRGGTAVLVSSHRLHELAEICDRFAFLRDGLVTVRTREDVGAPGGPEGLLREFDSRQVTP